MAPLVDRQAKLPVGPDQDGGQAGGQAGGKDTCWGVDEAAAGTVT